MIQPTYQTLGDENLDEDALDAILAFLPESHQIQFCSGFDWESKVIAVTDQSVVIGALGIGDDDELAGEIELACLYSSIDSISNDGRTLVIDTIDGASHEYRMGEERVVRRLVRIIRDRMRQRQGAREDEFDWGAADWDTTEQMDEEVDADASTGIVEKVKFWEEQDKINQELIPRVIRQHELFARHVADHENLPLIAGNAISEALAEAREEQRRQHEAELAAVRAEMDAQRRRHEAALAEVESERDAQQRQYIAEREEQRRQHETELAALRQERAIRGRLVVGIAAGAAAISAVAVILSFIV